MMIGLRNNVAYTIFPGSARAFKQTGPGESTIVTEKPEIKPEEQEEHERFYICVYCSNIITSPGDITEISGNHYHKFINPAGIAYHIRSFSHAQGCLSSGEPTREFTWFPGYSWSIAYCSRCLIHLGWLYESGGHSFFGIISEKITENW